MKIVLILKKNLMNLNRETPSKITPSKEIFAKKKSIFEEFSDKNMGSNKTSQNSQLKRKQVGILYSNSKNLGQ